MKNEICCICGTKATKRHYSIIGGIPFPVCLEHYKTHGTMLGWCDKIKGNRAGLSKDGEFVDMKFYGQKETK